jgi:hypothetical protein
VALYWTYCFQAENIFEFEFQGHVRWTAQSWCEKNSLAYCMNVGGPRSTCSTLQGVTNFGIVDTLRDVTSTIWMDLGFRHKKKTTTVDNDIIDLKLYPVFSTCGFV